MAQSGGKSTSFDWVLLFLLAVSLSGNVLLGSFYYRDHEAKRAADRMKTGVQVGEVVGKLTAKELGGPQATIPYTRFSQPTVLYVMKASCVWCQRNEANVRSIAANSAFNFVMLSLDSDETVVRRYVEGAALSGQPVFYAPDAATIASLGLGSTPQTIVISPAGEVRKVWRGAFVGDSSDEIQSFFSVRLPGLVEPALRNQQF